MGIIAQCNPLSLAQVGGLGTVGKIFPNKVGGVATLTPALLIPPGSGRLEGVEFKIKAAGWASVLGTSPTLDIALYIGSSLTASANAVIMHLASAVSVTTAATYPWSLSATMNVNTKSGLLQGNGLISINNPASPAIQALVTTGLTVFDMTQEPPVYTVSAVVTPLQFCLGVIFGVTSASNLAQMDSFYIAAD
jgi:hypothetical protein